jgi:hypothetical protein
MVAETMINAATALKGLLHAGSMEPSRGALCHTVPPPVPDERQGRGVIQGG